MKTEHLLLHRIFSNYLIVAIPNFFIGTYECDLYTVNVNHFSTEYEIKKTVADFKRDFNKNNHCFNWEEKRRNTETKHELIESGKRTNRFYYVVPETILGLIEIPKYAGLITFDPNNNWSYFETIKKAPRLHPNPIDQDDITKIVKKLNYRHYSLIFNTFEKE